MCGVIGVIGKEPVNQLIYDGLQMLQHRGQDAAGICTTNGRSFFFHKGQGMVRDIFRTRNMRDLHGNSGIAHVRYPTQGKAHDLAEAQPFYVNSPFGIALSHNGNLTNTHELFPDVIHKDLRHINTTSDSEVLLNVLAHELEVTPDPAHLKVKDLFDAVTRLHARVRGAYAVVSMIAGYGMLAFRDPYGIRPLVIGKRMLPDGGCEWMISSESVTFAATGFEYDRDVAPGEAVYIDFDGNFHSRQCADNPVLSPCLFEYVYFARPDSTIDGVSVYQARLNMGIILADKIRKELPNDIDVVMPIPDTSRPIALELAGRLGIPYREGLIKNRYIGRTFIMPGQAVRKKSVRQKLSPVGSEFEGKKVLLVDDSIVRGTTSKEIVEMARSMGAEKVYLASAAPEVRYPNVYGIDMPTSEELIAYNKTNKEISDAIGADGVVFQDLQELEKTVKALNPNIERFEDSCFNGVYVTGDVNKEYLDNLAKSRMIAKHMSKAQNDDKDDDEEENDSPKSKCL